MCISLKLEEEYFSVLLFFILVKFEYVYFFEIRGRVF